MECCTPESDMSIIAQCMSRICKNYFIEPVKYNYSTFVNKIVYETPILSTAAKDVTDSLKDIYNLTDQE